MPRPPIPAQQLPSGRWVIRYRDPSGRQRNETHRTAREANRRLDAVRADVRRGEYIDPPTGSETFRTFAKQWAASGTGRYHPRGWPPSSTASILTSGRYRSWLSTASLEATQTALSNGTPGEQSSYHEPTKSRAQGRRTPRDASAATRPQGLSAKGQGRPTRREGPTGGRPDQGRGLAILEATPARCRAAVALGVTGLRVGEVSACHRRPTQPRAANGCSSTANYNASGPRSCSPDRKPRRSGPWRCPPRSSSSCAAICATTRAAASCSEVVAARRCDETISTVGVAPRAGRRRAGPGPFRVPYSAPFAASSMLAEGAPITAVAGHLGDTVETVQRIYAHWLRDDRDIPAEVLDRILPGEVETTAAGSMTDERREDEVRPSGGARQRRRHRRRLEAWVIRAGSNLTAKT